MCGGDENLGGGVNGASPWSRQGMQVRAMYCTVYRYDVLYMQAQGYLGAKWKGRDCGGIDPQQHTQI